MAIVEVNIDATKTLALLNNAGKRMAYAAVNALNKTAKAIQTTEQQHTLGEFTIRKPDFIRRQAAVIKAAEGGSGFANVKSGRFEARISVGQKPRLLLSGFEEGDERRPVKGKNVGVPLTGGPARPNESSPVVPEFRFSALALRKQLARGGMSKRKSKRSVTIEAHITRTGAVQWKGTQRTFLLTKTAKAPLGGVFQRMGKGRGDIRMVYSFAAPMRLKKRLKFVETGERLARQVFAENLRHEVNAALAYNLLGVKL